MYMFIYIELGAENKQLEWELLELELLNILFSWIMLRIDRMEIYDLKKV